MLLVGQEVDGQRQPTPRQHRDQTVLTEGTDQTVEGHGRDVTDHRAQLQTEATMGRQQGIAGHLGSHLAIAQDEMGQDGEDGFTPRTLDAPDGETA